MNKSKELLLENNKSIRKNITLTEESLEVAASIQITDFSSLVRAAIKHFATLDKAERDSLIHNEYIPTRISNTVDNVSNTSHTLKVRSPKTLEDRVAIFKASHSSLSNKVDEYEND